MAAALAAASIHSQDTSHLTLITPFCPRFTSLVCIVFKRFLLTVGLKTSVSIANISSKVTDLKQFTVTTLYEKKLLQETIQIINDTIHILHDECVPLPSFRKFAHPKQIGSVCHSFLVCTDFKRQITRFHEGRVPWVMCAVCCIYYL